MNVTQELVQNPKVVHAVAAATASVGTSTWLSWIPADIGKLGTLVGIVLSTVLIVVHITKLIHDRKIRDIELERQMLELENLKTSNQ